MLQLKLFKIEDKHILVEGGLIGDDFIHGRVTLKVYKHDGTGFWPLKYYVNTEIVASFDDQRDTGGEYAEKIIGIGVDQTVKLLIK
jgi:hypothetical protein